MEPSLLFPLGDGQDKFVAIAQSCAQILATTQLMTHATPEYLEAMYRARAFLASSYVDEFSRVVDHYALARIAKQRSRHFGSTEGFGPPVPLVYREDGDSELGRII